MYVDFLIIQNLNPHYLSVLSFVCYAGLSVLEQGDGSMPRITAGLGFGMERRISLISPKCGMIPPLLLCLSRMFGLGVWNAGRIKSLVLCEKMLKKREEIMQLHTTFIILFLGFWQDSRDIVEWCWISPSSQIFRQLFCYGRCFHGRETSL